MLLVLRVDLDQGRTTPVGSPAIGEESVREAAIALATADYEDSDVNVLFEGLPNCERIEDGAVEVAAVTAGLFGPCERILHMIVATFSIPPEALALEEALREVPEMRVQAERTAARSTEWVMPCLWITDAESDAVEEAVESDTTVDDVVETKEFDEELFYQIEWSDDVERRVDNFVDMEGSILEASGDAGGWRVKVRFASREQLEEFREHFDERGHSFELRDIFEPGTPHQTFGELTPDQREALLAAAKHGYFDVPREITARDLAAKLDISHQALSERLRRGTENIVTATLTAEDDLA